MGIRVFIQNLQSIVSLVKICLGLSVMHWYFPQLSGSLAISSAPEVNTPRSRGARGVEITPPPGEVDSANAVDETSRNVGTLTPPTNNADNVLGIPIIRITNHSRVKPRNTSRQ